MIKYYNPPVVTGYCNTVAAAVDMPGHRTTSEKYEYSKK